MSHIVAQIAYDGSGYFGWQETKCGHSVASTLARVIQTILQEPITLQAASRTDRGVHAEGQIVDFKTQEKLNDIHKILVSINQLLPPDIRCLQLGHAPYETFHPTLSAISKTYRYFLSTDPVQLPHQRHTHWHVHRPINMELLFSLPQLFIGTHDFRGFCNRRAQLDEENTVRTIFALNIEQQPHGLVFEITGDNFLYKMVRNIVGTLLWIARGKLPVTAIQEALSSRKRAFAGVTAPAHGLTLTRVHYPISLFQ